MGPVTDAFLLEVAGISASLLGFFVVGLFFYVQRGIFPHAADHAQGYLKTAARTVIYLYGLAVLLSLSLVVLTSGYVALLYATLSVGLVGSVLQTALASRRLQSAIGVRVMSQVAVWMATTLVVGIPWVLGGLAPSRTDFTWALMVICVFAFLSTVSLMLSTFDISDLEAVASGRRLWKGSGQPENESVPPSSETEADSLVGTSTTIQLEEK